LQLKITEDDLIKFSMTHLTAQDYNYKDIEMMMKTIQ